MDFIERIFGVSPDGGDGSFELLFYAACLVAVGVAVWRLRFRHSATPDEFRQPGDR